MMMKKKYLLKLLAASLLGLSSLSYALQIDNMLLVSDKQGNGVFALTNELPETSLVSGKIVEINVVDGQIQETPYTKENLKDWKVTLTNPNLILETNTTKQVGVRSLCGGDCNFKEDKVYQVYFSPIPYSRGKGATKPTLGIQYGYAPVFIIPAKQAVVHYQLENRLGKLYVKNNSNTFLRIQIDACKSKKDNSCRATYTALSGREIEFKLPEKIQSKNLNLRIATHDNSYFKEFIAAYSKAYKE